MRIKRPDSKNAQDLVLAAKREMEFTLTLKVTEASSSTLIRNIYEAFRMLGDALLVAKGVETTDHITSIKELISIDVKTTRPIQVIENLRRLRHNINYYGYQPSTADANDVLSFAKDNFPLIYEAVSKKISK